MTERQLNLIQSLDEQLAQCNSSTDASNLLGHGWETRWPQIDPGEATKCIGQLREILRMERGY